MNLRITAPDGARRGVVAGHLRRSAVGLAVVAAALLAGVPAGAVGVRPLVIDLSLGPGDTGQFALTLTPAGASERVQVRFYQPTQLITGDLTYQLADPSTFPAVGWIELNPREVDLPADREVTLNGRVNVPFGARGSHTVVLMVEPEVRAGPGAIGVQIRYAVRLNIRVTAVTQPPRVDIEDLQFQSGDGKPVVRLRVKNPTGQDFMVQAEATIRDPNRRLVERIPLLTEVARRSGLTETRIYPGSLLEFSGPVTASIPPGQYELRAFVRYADRGQVSLARELTLQQALTPGGPPSVSQALRVEPAQLIFRVPPGGLATQTLQVTNLSTQPVQVLAYAREVAPGYSRSVWPLLRLRTTLPLRLGPGEQARLAVTAQSSREQGGGGYYGTMVLRSWPQDADPRSAPPLAEVASVVAVLVGEPPAAALAAGELTYRPPQQPGDDALLLFPVQNTGAIHVEPGGRLRLETEDGQSVGDFLAAPEGGRAWLFPGQTTLLITRVSPLKPGNYRVRVRVESGGRLVLEESRTLSVSPES